MRKEKLQEMVLSALTYCRLQGDMYALEAEIAEKTAAPTVAAKEEKNGLKKLWNSLTAEFKKEVNREEARDLTAERAAAAAAFAEFKGSCPKKVVELAENPEKLKKFLDKKLFKRDRYGLKRMQFALAAVIGDERKYLRDTDSLEMASEIWFDDCKKWGELYASYGVNCQKLAEKPKTQQGADLEAGVLVGLGVFSLLALSPLGLGLTGLGVLNRACREYSGKKTAQAVTRSEQVAFLAMKLTLLEKGRAVMDEVAFKAEVDEFLKWLGGLRADAEYGWLVEKMDAPACIAKIQTCDLCLERLAELLGV